MVKKGNATFCEIQDANSYKYSLNKQLKIWWISKWPAFLGIRFLEVMELQYLKLQYLMQIIPIWLIDWLTDRWTARQSSAWLFRNMVGLTPQEVCIGLHSRWFTVWLEQTGKGDSFVEVVFETRLMLLILVKGMGERGSSSHIAVTSSLVPWPQGHMLTMIILKMCSACIMHEILAGCLNCEPCLALKHHGYETISESVKGC